MTFTVRIRGAHSQPIARDFACHDCGPFSAEVSRDADTHPCPDCGAPTPFVLSPVHGSVKATEAIRGSVAKPDSPMYLDTRELGNGMPMAEWRAKRDKLYEERRHKESKEFGRFSKGVK